jgi:uncharacterized protein with NAD-binding domain and iron-sulfur cluster
MAKRKVAILGGGVSAITVAMQLTDDPAWRDQFESITIYQLGWRLGGKGATGRTDAANRILEHGLHIWLGYYENAFQLIQKVYAEAGRTAGSPIRTWTEAFTGQDWVGVMDRDNGLWNPWLFYVPPNNLVPGGGQAPSLAESVERGMVWLASQLDYVERMRTDYQTRVGLGAELLELAARVTDEAHSHTLILRFREVIEHAGNWARSDALDVDFRALRMAIEMGATILHGLIAENIGTYADLEKLEGIDFARWLGKYNSNPCISDLAVNPLLRGMYDFAFAYENGEVDRPNFAAAPALRTIFRMCLSFKGSIFYKMNAGMGDTIFAPAYEALRNRGVDIQFFHKVKSLELSADKSQVARIHVGRQATLKAGPYLPFVPVPVDDHHDPLPCWPAQPLYEQLVEGEALRACKADLESFWCDWSDVEEVALEAGKDFDTVVFGISLGSVPYLCGELVAASPAWANMAANVATVRTQSLQLWLTPNITQLGWSQPSPILDAWAEPLDTWADMTDIMSFESWTGGKPGSLAYFCGSMVGGIPNQSDTGFPARAKAEVETAADLMLRGDIQTLWSSVAPSGLPATDVVARHARANIDPSERYVQSLADSAKYRLPANGSGFANLVITGDWIRNGYNAGCVEAAVWSGIQAANTILGRPLNEGVITG